MLKEIHFSVKGKFVNYIVLEEKKIIKHFIEYMHLITGDPVLNESSRIFMSCPSPLTTVVRK